MKDALGGARKAAKAGVQQTGFARRHLKAPGPRPSMRLELPAGRPQRLLGAGAAPAALGAGAGPPKLLGAALTRQQKLRAAATSAYGTTKKAARSAYEYVKAGAKYHYGPKMAAAAGAFAAGRRGAAAGVRFAPVGASRATALGHQAGRAQRAGLQAAKAAVSTGRAGLASAGAAGAGALERLGNYYHSAQAGRRVAAGGGRMTQRVSYGPAGSRRATEVGHQIGRAQRSALKAVRHPQFKRIAPLAGIGTAGAAGIYGHYKLAGAITRKRKKERR
jgi:hypothetical protein